MPVQPFSYSLQTVTFSFPGPLEVQSGNFVWVNPYTAATIVQVQAAAGRFTQAVADPVIFDVNYYDPDTELWVTIFTTQAERPTVPAGELIGDLAVPDIVNLEQGMALCVDVDATGGGATPTDEDYNVMILMRVE